MTYGKDFEHIIEAYNIFKDVEGYAVPRAIAEKPALEFYEAYYLNAFNTLSSSRSIGMSEGYIPLSEILNYAAYLEDDDVSMFLEIIRALDSEYVAKRAKDSESKK